MNQQRQLLEPFPPKVVKQLPGSAKRPPIDFVSWTDKIQRLLQVCGGFNWDVSEPFISGDLDEQLGVRGTLEVVVDGQTRRVSGMGQGKDAKNAETDAFARACGKLGLGLHLWTQGGEKDGGYWLPGVLDREVSDAT